MRFLFTLLCAAMTLSLPLFAQGLDDMTDQDRKAFRAEIRAYLLENPEVLMEAIGVLERRQQEAKANQDVALVDQYRATILDDGFSYVGGNPDGDITLVEFIDYRCTYCRKAHDDVAELITSDGNIRFVVKEFPILGEQSMLSSQLAVAVLHKAGPEKYEEIGDFLMTFNGNLTDSAIAKILARFDLDPAEITAYMDDPAVMGHIGKVHELAGRLAISGTPTFVIGDDMVRGFVPLDNLRAIVAQNRG